MRTHSKIIERPRLDEDVVPSTEYRRTLNRIRQPNATPRSIQLDVDLIVRTSTNRTTRR